MALLHDSADRPARELEEIEVTPEMIDAGLTEIWRHPITEPDRDVLWEAVSCVLRAALRARHLSLS